MFGLSREVAAINMTSIKRSYNANDCIAKVSVDLIPVMGLGFLHGGGAKSYLGVSGCCPWSDCLGCLGCLLLRDFTF